MTLHFEPITIERQREYLALFERCAQKSSDYSFVNLWGWADEYGLIWAWDENLVWIKQTKPETFFWAPVGRREDADWKKILESEFSAMGIKR